MAEEDPFPMHRLERDGVPVYWTPDAPRFTGVLMFRVGISDESVMTRGLTHLVEHLAMSEFTKTRPRFPFNGSVDSLRTMFWATGTPEEVTAVLNGVCRSIAQLPLDRLEKECRVLRTESADRASNPAETFAFLRFGPRGHGLVGVYEFGLEVPTAAVVADWAARKFTRQNAAAWFSGPVPDTLSFDSLPHGLRQPCPVSTGIDDLRLPAAYFARDRLVALAFVTPREDWFGVPLGIAADRLMNRLRFRDGLVYSVRWMLDHIDATSSHSMLWTNCLSDSVHKVEAALLEELDDLAVGGPTRSELQIVRDAFARAWRDPESIHERFDALAANDLLGFPTRSTTELIADLDERPLEDWAKTVQSALATALLCLPAGASPTPDRFYPYPFTSKSRVEGHSYRAAIQRYPWSKKAPKLVVGQDGVTWINPNGNFVTVRYEKCTAMLFPEGHLQLLGEDGFTISVRIEEWSRGDHAHATILQWLPRAQLLVIPRR